MARVVYEDEYLKSRFPDLGVDEPQLFNIIVNNYRKISREHAVDAARDLNRNVYRPSSDKNALAVTTPSGKHYQYFLVGPRGDKLTTDNHDKLTGGKKSTKKHGTRKHRARKTRTRKQ
jgi:hypothetical protein